MARSVFVWMIVCALSFSLSACAGGKNAHVLVSATATSFADSRVAGRHSIFVATTRAAASNKAEVYGGNRSEELGLVRVDVTVPLTHVKGALERPKRGKIDPAKTFAATSITAYDQSSFEQALRADIARRGGRALVFIHGFNTRFDDSVYRMTQLVHDAGYSGTPILFSWASAGRITDYVYDTNSATAARDRLEMTLRIVERAGAKRIDIIAHSMGNWVTMEALRQLAITGDHDLHGKLGDVLLASPDIDVDVFKSQMRRYGTPKRPFVVMLSGDDRALQISSIIAGNRPRVGDYSDAQELAALGVIVINLSNVKSGDRLNHSKFTDNPVIVDLLGDSLRRGDQLSVDNAQLTDRVSQLTTGIGGAVTSAVDIIITTPLRVVTVVVGGE